MNRRGATAYLLVILSLSACTSLSKVEQAYATKDHLYQNALTLNGMYWDIRTTLNWRFKAWNEYAGVRLRLSLALQNATGTVPRIDQIPEAEVAADDKMLLGPELFELVNQNRLEGVPALKGVDGKEILRQGDKDLKDLMSALPGFVSATYRSVTRLDTLGNALDFSIASLKHKDEYRAAVEKLQSVADRARERFSIDFFDHAKKFAAAAEEKKVFEALKAAYVGFQSWQKYRDLPDVLKAEEATVADIYSLADKLVESTEASSKQIEGMSQMMQEIFEGTQKDETAHLAAFIQEDTENQDFRLAYSAAFLIGRSYFEEIGSFLRQSAQQDIEDLKSLNEVVGQLRETWRRVASIHEWTTQTYKKSFWDRSGEGQTSIFDTRDLVLPIAVAQYRLARSKKLNDTLEIALSKSSTGTTLSDKLSVIRALKLTRPQ